MAQPIRPGRVVIPRQSTRYALEVTYGGDLAACLDFVKKVGDGYGFNVELHASHDAIGDAAEVTLRSASSDGLYAETLDNLKGIQEYAMELGLYVD